VKTLTVDHYLRIDHFQHFLHNQIFDCASPSKSHFFPSFPLHSPPCMLTTLFLPSVQARASVLWERLPSKRVTASPYSPLQIGNSQTVPAILIRHLQSSLITYRSANYLQGPSVTCRARSSPGVISQIPRPRIPAVPGRPSQAVIRTNAKIPALTQSRTDWTPGLTTFFTV